MSIALLQPLPARAAYTDEPIYRLTVDQYHALIESGELTADDPVELIQGILVFKMPKNTPHATSTRFARRAVEALLPAGYFYDSQEPITLADGEPEPDGVVVRGKMEDYVRVHPGPADVALVIEVADSSLERDRTLKMQSYAQAGIPIYWILNLLDRHLELYATPDSVGTPNATYASRLILRPGESVEVVVAGMHVGLIAVADLFPPVTEQGSGT